MTQLFCSTGAGIHHVAKLQLQDERGKKRQKFKPATLVDDLRAQDPPKTRKGLARAAKAFLATEKADERSEQLCSLPVQGDMARRFEGNAAELWVRAVQDLPSDVMKFALNASLEILATNVNLHTWGKETNTICALCSQEHQTLLHVLNACPKAMVLRRYSQRHDAVLALLGDFVKWHLPSSYHTSVDLPSATFPQYIVPLICGQI